MAIDFEGLITKYAGEDGAIQPANIAKIASAISSAVGREFVAKERYNAKLDEIETLKGEKQTAEDNATSAERWRTKAEKLQKDIEDMKADYAAKEQLSKVKAAYRKLLEESGIDSKRLDTVVRATIFDGMNLGEDGKLEGADALKTAIEHDWADFKVSTEVKGANVETPPSNPSGSGANPRAAEIARQYHERKYGKAAEANKNEVN